MTEVSQSIRLLARLAEVVSKPADYWAADLTGLASMPPEALSSLYHGRSGALFQKALATDLAFSDIDVGENFMVELKTAPDIGLAVRIACAPISEITAALRHMAASIYCKAINGAVRKSDRDAMFDMLGADGLLTAQRQAEVFWPSLAQLASVDARLVAKPIEETPEPTEKEWKRPATSMAIAGQPRAIQHAYAILLQHVGGVSVTIARLLQARLGRPPEDLGPKSLSPQQSREIRDLLERKAPTWSTIIA